VTRVFVITFRLLVPLRVLSLKRSIAGAFAVSYRILTYNMQECVVLELIPPREG